MRTTVTKRRAGRKQRGGGHPPVPYKEAVRLLGSEAGLLRESAYRNWKQRGVPSAVVLRLLLAQQAAS